MFAGDQRIADDDPAADARAERQQHDAVILLARPAPELAVSRRIGVVGKRDRQIQMMAEAIANRKIPPTRQIAWPQDYSTGNIHRPGRRDASPSDIAVPNARMGEHLPHPLRHPGTGILGPQLLLRGHREVSNRLAGIIHQPDLDIRATHIRPDEEGLLGVGNRGVRSGRIHRPLNIGSGWGDLNANAECPSIGDFFPGPTWGCYTGGSCLGLGGSRSGGGMSRQARHGWILSIAQAPRRAASGLGQYFLIRDDSPSNHSKTGGCSRSRSPPPPTRSTSTTASPRSAKPSSQPTRFPARTRSSSPPR